VAGVGLFCHRTLGGRGRGVLDHADDRRTLAGLNWPGPPPGTRFILHLYRRSVAVRGQLIAGVLDDGLAGAAGGRRPRVDQFDRKSGADHALADWCRRATWHRGVQHPVAGNLYFNTPPDARWHINLLCVALGGMFLYDLVLYSDARCST